MTTALNDLTTVLDPFFNAWAERVIEWFETTKANYREDHKVLDARFAHEVGYSKDHSNAYRELERTWEKAVGRGWLQTIKYDKRGAVEKRVRRDMQDRKVYLIAKVEEKVGLITEVKLHIGINYAPNGLVIGDKGSVRVESIEAGGWNIQCFHYRVLVKPIKPGKG